MKYTLLEMTKRILESMESDEVSDINETPEAVSVANIIKECYFDIIGQHAPDETEGIYKLDASGDNLKPALMYLPQTASNIQWLKYNNGTLLQPNWIDLRYISNDEYFFYQTGIDPADTTFDDMTIPVNGSNFVLRFRNERYPTYYTLFDDSSIVFDAYNASVESTLTQARSLAFGELVAVFLMENAFVPDLDPRQFQLLLQESKVTAFLELKQSANPVAERKARKNHILTQKNKHDNDPSSSNQKHVSYGRRGTYWPPMKRAMRAGS